LENGFVTPVTYPDGDHYLTGASPAQFDGRPVGELKASPTHGEHTDDVMRELGLTDEQITALKSRGIII
jgi:formyl-CoA transferase